MVNASRHRSTPASATITTAQMQPQSRPTSRPQPIQTPPLIQHNIVQPDTHAIEVVISQRNPTPIKQRQVDISAVNRARPKPTRIANPVFIPPKVN